MATAVKNWPQENRGYKHTIAKKQSSCVLLILSFAASIIFISAIENHYLVDEACIKMVIFTSSLGILKWSCRPAGSCRGTHWAGVSRWASIAAILVSGWEDGLFSKLSKHETRPYQGPTHKVNMFEGAPSNFDSDSMRMGLVRPVSSSISCGFGMAMERFHWYTWAESDVLWVFFHRFPFTCTCNYTGFYRNMHTNNTTSCPLAWCSQAQPWQPPAMCHVSSCWQIGLDLTVRQILQQHQASGRNGPLVLFARQLVSNLPLKTWKLTWFLSCSCYSKLHSKEKPKKTNHQTPRHFRFLHNNSLDFPPFRLQLHWSDPPLRHLGAQNSNAFLSSTFHVEYASILGKLDGLWYWLSLSLPMTDAFCTWSQIVANFSDSNLQQATIRILRSVFFPIKIVSFGAISHFDIYPSVTSSWLYIPQHLPTIIDSESS